MFIEIEPAEFDEVYDILEEAFPAEELRTREGQRSLIENNKYKLNAYKNGEGNIAAVLAEWRLGDIIFIEHIAAHKNERGSGLGGRLLAEYISNAGRPVVLEVEPPETDIARRRIGFYRRLGFCLNERPYIQPAIREGVDSIPLMIMSYPEPLTEAEFDRFRELAYKYVYGRR